jgi:NADH dehydrogenase
VVNLIGILNERGSDGSGFAKAHVALTEKIIAACQVNKINRLLHMSALNAEATQGKSHYLRTKGEAEDLAHAAEGMQVTSFRPSVIFGEGDSFFKRFAQLLVVPSYMFMLPSGYARFAPVWVNDVVSAILQTIDDPQHYGKRYNLCGPHSYTLQELVEYTAKLMGRKRWVIPLGDKPSYFAARLMEFIPTKPYSVDNYHSSQTDSVCSQENPNHFEQLGIMPHSIEAIMPRYFTTANLKQHYSLFRNKARRS